MKNASVKISGCCNPCLSDSIVGYLTKDKKVTVHNSNCINVHTLDKEKEVPVLWIRDNLPGIKLKLVLVDKVGVLAKMLNIISSHRLNIKKVATRAKKENVVVVITLDSGHLVDMDFVVSSLKKEDNVLSVEIEKKAQ